MSLEDEIERVRADDACIKRIGDLYMDGTLPEWAAEQLDELHRASLTAAEDGARRTAWQAIETVPRDGTRLITWQPSEGSSHEAILQWDADRRLWLDDRGSWFIIAPTHWQPLPAPPALATKAPKTSNEGQNKC